MIGTDDLASIERDIYGIHPEPDTCERCEEVVSQEDMDQLPEDSGLCGHCWNMDRAWD